MSKKFKIYLSTFIKLFIIFCTGTLFADTSTVDHTHTAKFVAIPALARNANDISNAPKDCTLANKSIEIGKYEVTNIEYAYFLNAVARTADPYELFSPLHEQHFWGGITRTNLNGKFYYMVKPGYGEMPVTYVSAHNAIRFANWLHFGRPSTGISELGTTEGSDTVGAYDTTQLVGTALGPKRNVSARYFLPSCGEWLTAAFFDSALNIFTDYSGGKVPPVSGGGEIKGRAANYYNDRWAIPYPHLAPVRSYSNNQSSLGTLNQNGNVLEWVEDANGMNQMALGGSLFLPRDTIHRNYRDSELANKKLSSLGFRIARQLTTREVLHFSAQETPVYVELPSTKVTKPIVMSMEWTLIDQPGNISDFRTGYGCVAQNFEIARTEVTNSQYADFLNAVASEGDTHQLYLEDMTNGVIGGILRVIDRGQITYAAKPGQENRPAAYLSWFALARLANWYHYGRPNGHQVLGITEGDQTLGAYDTRGFDTFESQYPKRTVTPDMLQRNAGAKYFLPSNDEWYKASYYDPERTGLRKYWSYPGRSDSPPDNRAGTSSVNYQIGGLGEGGPYYVSNAGNFGARGYYDVVDMGGNLWEWLETWRGLGGELGWRRDIPTKGLRGGSFNYIDIGLSYLNIDPGYPSDHYFVYGGRLARTVTNSTAENTSWCIPPVLRSGTVENLQYLYRRRILIALGLIILSITGILWFLRNRSRNNHYTPGI